jgi:hypothetical protein
VIVCASRADLNSSSDEGSCAATELLTTVMWIREEGEPHLPRIVFSISSLNNYNIEKPLLWALRWLSGDADLVLLENHAA